MSGYFVISDVLIHGQGHGIPHEGGIPHSGRYEWGSGGRPHQRDYILMGYDTLKRKGLNDEEIAWAMGYADVHDMADNLLGKDIPFHIRAREEQKRGLSEQELVKKYNLRSGADLKQKISISRQLYDREGEKRIVSLKEHGYKEATIADILGVSETTVRKKLALAQDKDRSDNIAVAEFLKKQIAEKTYLDVGKGEEFQIQVGGILGVSREKKEKAIKMLESEGYVYVPNYKVPQPFGNKSTTYSVLMPPGKTWKDLHDNAEKIQTIEGYSFDNGKTIYNIEPPKSMDPKRLSIVYAEDGGTSMDGVIQVRRTCKDLQLPPGNIYAQGRIAVNGTHYLKGMIVYSDDLPEGCDVRFWTNKHKGTPVMGTDKLNTVLKPMKRNKKTGEIDENNPFGTQLLKNGQSHYIDDDGNDQLSLINRVRDEGNWNSWGEGGGLPSQFLAKQPQELIETQLGIAKADKYAEYADIMKVTNPSIRKYLLEDFADGCDSAAVKLRGAKLPGQCMQVILPGPTLKDDECFCPRFKDGEKVFMVRFPHQGTFEIVVATNNLKQQHAVNDYGLDRKDVCVINGASAQKLSGADFDGDTVMVVPMRNLKITVGDTIPELATFDPKEAYPGYPGCKKMTKTSLEMGKITNLIMDMTIQGADEDEIVRATKHALVVIDAEKHGLDYTRSYKENRISELKTKYQGKANAGAATIITKAKHDVKSPAVSYYRTDPNTGEKIPYYEKARYDKKSGTWKTRKEDTPMMDLYKDARELIKDYDPEHPEIRGNAKEEAYAEFANYMKSLANEARLEALHTPNLELSNSAATIYANEVTSLRQKSEDVERNAPRERLATLKTYYTVLRAKAEDPDLWRNEKELKKIKAQALQQAREEYGSHRGDVMVKVTPKEWEAIDAGAVPPSILRHILENTDSDSIRKHAFPDSRNTVSRATGDYIKALYNSKRYTIGVLQEEFGVSAADISKILAGEYEYEE